MVNAEALHLALLQVVRALTRGITSVLHRGVYRAPHEMANLTQTGQRDAGWATILDAEGDRLRGRGRLVLRRWGAHPDGTPSFEARLDSFLPAAATPIRAGDAVLLHIEASNEQYPVTVHTTGVGSTISVSWPGDELPATLRELGGD